MSDLNQLYLSEISKQYKIEMEILEVYKGAKSLNIIDIPTLDENKIYYLNKDLTEFYLKVDVNEDSKIDFEINDMTFLGNINCRFVNEDGEYVSLNALTPGTYYVKCTLVHGDMGLFRISV